MRPEHLTLTRWSAQAFPHSRDTALNRHRIPLEIGWSSIAPSHGARNGRSLWIIDSIQNEPITSPASRSRNGHYHQVLIHPGC